MKTILQKSSLARQLKLSAGVLIALGFANQLQAQNSSFNANVIPINGVQSCAFGLGALMSNTVQGTDNVAMGYRSLFNNTSGSSNSAVGSMALYLNTTADYCSATGYTALYWNTTGDANTATGAYSLTSNSTGAYNTGHGAYTLYSNNGNYNTANGFLSLYMNYTGNNNSTCGAKALTSNNSGSYNTAVGSDALQANFDGSENTACGANALYSNTSGNRNVATGQNALYSNTTGIYSVATGGNALRSNTSGLQNTAIGNAALLNNTRGGFNTACGGGTLNTNILGGSLTALGNAADVSVDGLSNATALGSGAIVNAGSKVRIGNSTVTVIEGQVAYTWPSDGRFKENITEEVKGLAFIKLLRPVVYNFNTKKFEEFLTKNMSAEQKQLHLEGKDFAPSTAVRQSGFIAQEVEQAAKKSDYNFNGIHVPENDNDNYSLAYAEFVVPLVKGMQEQQKMIEDQKMMIEKLQQQVTELQKGQVSTTTGLDQNTMTGFYMEQNAPNPFSHETVIKFNLPENISNAYMTVCDLSGKQIKLFPIDQRGTSSITVTSEQLANGMYIYSIIADGQLLGSKRMVLSGQ